MVLVVVMAMAMTGVARAYHGVHVLEQLGLSVAVRPHESQCLASHQCAVFVSVHGVCVLCMVPCCVCAYFLCLCMVFVCCA